MGYSFLYTLKNPHNIPPTKYELLDDYRRFIFTFNVCEIQFGDCLIWYRNNLNIVDQCDKEYSMINCDFAYEEDETYGSSLCVNTAPKGRTNYFRVLDYEIFAPA